MDNLYVPQTAKVKVNLQPVELDRNYEEKLKNKIKDKYGDTCYLGGFIKKSSIEIVKISTGRRVGSHLHGTLTFHVEFTALYCIPIKDKLIRCKITKLNKFGAEAIVYPINVIIPRQLQQYENIEIFATIKETDYVYVKILNYTITENKLVVVGIITELVLDKYNYLELAQDGLLSENYLINLTEDISPPEINPLLGNNSSLNQLKDKITPYSVDWGRKIKKMINPYELIDIYRPNTAKNQYSKSIIKYDEFGKNGLHHIFSRAYFKLWEVLKELKLLDQFENKNINIANLAEGPGGFINALIDFRNQQHATNWKNDTYNAITLKSSKGSNIMDWDSQKASKYFNARKKEGYSINLSYGDPNKNDGNLLDIDNIVGFTETIGSNKCHLVTADGGIELETDEDYLLQELNNVKLFFSEVLLALSIQEKDGTFILKIYDVYYDITLQIIELLSIYYEKIIIIKPRTSRPANSEKYLVCTKFQSINEDQLSDLHEMFDNWLEKIETKFEYSKNEKFVVKLFDMTVDSQSIFLQNIIEFNDYNITMQIEKITEGLNLAKNNEYNQTATIKDYLNLQKDIAIKWCKQFNVPYITDFKIETLEQQKPTSETNKAKKAHQRTKDRVDTLRKLLKPGTTKTPGIIEKYLDVGCGNAEITVAIAKSYNVANVYGTDVFPVDKFKQPDESFPIIYFQMQNDKISLDSETVNLVTAFVAIHHFANFDQMIKEIHRVLTNKGYFYIREHDVPANDTELIKYLDKLHEGYEEEEGHGGAVAQYFSKIQLRNLLEKAGFKYISEFTYAGKNPQALYHSLFQKI